MGKNSKTDSLVEYVYVHIPFCLKKCGYCSFFSEKYSKATKEIFLTYLHKEIEKYQQQFAIRPKTIYFGGGTPSLLNDLEITNLIESIGVEGKNIEITLEANPINITRNYSELLSETLVNRISLGAQSFLDNELKLLGRLHNAKQICAAFEFLRNSGFENISLDLIYGLPNQKKKDVEFSVNKIIELNPEHVSIYCLSLEKNVPLFEKIDQIPDDETVSDFYYLIREKLISAGYLQYEISNFAKKDFESKHNLTYWNDKPYLGFGPSASGYLKICNSQRNPQLFRYSNPANMKKYFKQIETSDLFENFTKLTEKEYEEEFTFLSLRKTKGINLAEFHDKFGIDFKKKYASVIEKYSRNDFLRMDGEYLRLTPKAYFVSNEIFAEFLR